ncbi:MAG: hypothetical protein JST73_12880 [Actinobacteria bacterium]|nr:hypothetical protein [Actinomycetota bacterium]
MALVVAAVVFIAGAIGVAAGALAPLSVTGTVEATAIPGGAPAAHATRHTTHYAVRCGAALGNGPEHAFIDGFYLADHPCARAHAQRRRRAAASALVMIVGLVGVVVLLVGRRRRGAHAARNDHP